MIARALAAISLFVALGCGRPAAQPSRPSPRAESPTSAEAPLSGIGIRPILDPHGFAVGQLFAGSPAERAGLRVGDVVVGVDGESSARWTLDRTAQRLRGPAGSKVTLSLERGGVAMRMTITRDLLRDIPEVPR